jgi:hypothetical protein
VVTQRISVEDGAILKGSVQVQASGEQKKQPKAVEAPKHAEEAPKAAAASAGA